MHTEQVTLTDADSQELDRLSRSSGLSRPEILGRAVAEYLAMRSREARAVALRAGRGIWEGRTDLPTSEQLRSEWDGRRGERP
jgi:predicted transcriptional regulator